MEWVRLDPGSELIAEVELRQPEAMLAAQLERSKDVQAQSAAVAGLAAQRPVTYGVVNALRACMQNSNVYCRCPTSCPAQPPHLLMHSSRKSRDLRKQAELLCRRLQELLS